MVEVGGEQQCPRLGVAAGKIADRVGGDGLVLDHRGQGEIDGRAGLLRQRVERVGGQRRDRGALAGVVAFEIGGQARRPAQFRIKVAARLALAQDQQLDLLLRSEEHTSELQSLMRISYAVFCLKKKKTTHHYYIQHSTV